MSLKDTRLKEIDGLLVGLYAERRIILRAKRLDRPFDSGRLASIEAQIDDLEIEEAVLLDDGTRENVEAVVARLINIVRGVVPPMKLDAAALDFAYGNLAASTNHKPTLEAFWTTASQWGWSKERFAKWAAGRQWWDR